MKERANWKLHECDGREGNTDMVLTVPHSEEVWGTGDVSLLSPYLRTLIYLSRSLCGGRRLYFVLFYWFKSSAYSLQHLVRPWGRPSLMFIGYRRYSFRSVTLITGIVLKFIMRGNIPQFPRIYLWLWLIKHRNLLVNILQFLNKVSVNILPLSTKTSAEYDMWSKGRRVEGRMQRHNDNVCCSQNIKESHPKRDGRDMYYALGFEKRLYNFGRIIYREETDNKLVWKKFYINIWA